MIAEDKTAISAHLLRAKVALVCFAPALAMAAGAAIQHVSARSSIEAVSTVTWAFLALFILLGWAVSELDKVAELWNVDGHSQYEIWKARLMLLKGFAASNAAGFSVYFLGEAAPGFFFRAIGVQGDPQLPDMVLFVFVSGASYMGVRFFAWLERKFFGGT